MDVGRINRSLPGSSLSRRTWLSPSPIGRKYWAPCIRPGKDTSPGIVEAGHILPRVQADTTGAHIVDALAVGEQRPVLVVDGRRLTVGEPLGDRSSDDLADRWASGHVPDGLVSHNRIDARRLPDREQPVGDLRRGRRGVRRPDRSSVRSRGS